MIVLINLQSGLHIVNSNRSSQNHKYLYVEIKDFETHELNKINKA